jgi:hypothetical protein
MEEAVLGRKRREVISLALTESLGSKKALAEPALVTLEVRYGVVVAECFLQAQMKTFRIKLIRKCTRLELRQSCHN